MMFPNPYGLLTNPVRLVGRSRATGFWISPWVAYGRPVILDTAQLSSPSYDARLKEYRTLDHIDIRRIAGPDEMPANALLVVIHPKMHADLMLRADYSTRTGPDLAAEMIDGVCMIEPGLSKRIGWTHFGVPVE